LRSSALSRTTAIDQSKSLGETMVARSCMFRLLRCGVVSTGPASCFSGVRTSGAQVLQKILRSRIDSMSLLRCGGEATWVLTSRRGICGPSPDSTVETSTLAAARPTRIAHRAIPTRLNTHRYFLSIISVTPHARTMQSRCQLR
jgi:hypothetical protein